MIRNEKNVGLWKKIGCMKTEKSESHLVPIPHQTNHIFPQKNLMKNWISQDLEQGCISSAFPIISPSLEQHSNCHKHPLYQQNKQFSLGNQSVCSPEKELKDSPIIIHKQSSLEEFKLQLKDALLLLKFMRKFILDVKIYLLEYGEEFKKNVETDFFCLMDNLRVQKQQAANKKALIEENARLKNRIEKAEQKIQLMKNQNNILIENIQQILKERQINHQVMEQLDKKNLGLESAKQELIKQNDEIKAELISLRKKFITQTCTNLRSIKQVNKNTSEGQLQLKSRTKLGSLLSKSKESRNVRAPFTESIYPAEKQHFIQYPSGIQNNRLYENTIGKNQNREMRLNKTSRQKNGNLLNRRPLHSKTGMRLPSSYSSHGLGNLEYRLNHIKTQITNQLKQAKKMFK